MSFDLSHMPSPDVVETISFERILAERKAAFIGLHSEEEHARITALLELESEPIVKLLQENSYRELLWRQRVNESARAVMLAFSSGSDLDQLAANFGVARLVVDPGNPAATPPVAPVMESDEQLRQRAQMAFEAMSVAGPRSAYITHALSADGRVGDVSAISPQPCEALITVLARDGDGTAPPDLLDAVAAALSEEDVRPIGDRVTVQSAIIIPYTVEATLYLFAGPEAEPVRAAAEARLQAYVGAQRRLGRDIRLSAIYAALHVDGVQRVELASPLVDVVLDDTQSAHCTAVMVAVGGMDE